MDDDDDLGDDDWAIFQQGLEVYNASSSDASTETSSEGIPDYSQLYLKCIISVVNDTLEELSILQKIINEPFDESWTELVKYRGISDRCLPCSQ